MLQVLLNIAVFDMSVQAACEAPRFATYSYPSSSEPHAYHPGRLNLEQRIPESTADELVQRWSQDRDAGRRLHGRPGRCVVRRNEDTACSKARPIRGDPHTRSGGEQSEVYRALRSRYAALIGAYSAHAATQSFPSTPVRIIVPFTPGSGIDIVGGQSRRRSRTRGISRSSSITVRAPAERSPASRRESES
jgi:hypothetical protein